MQAVMSVKSGTLEQTHVLGYSRYVVVQYGHLLPL